MPLIQVPFTRVAVDLVGPIAPMSDRGHRYILTVVDYATRYPEAVALKRIDTITVAEALLEMFTRVGLPKEILSDQGTQFVSEVMREITRLLSISQLVTTPYHPQCNGLVERFNGTLKNMLRKMCAERPKDWDRYLPALLFAYREAPQESLGFSPFELLYGRTVRGPMSILKQLWSKETDEYEVNTTYQYVVDLRERLDATCRLAQEQLGKAQANQKNRYDLKTKDRTFKVGEQVLILLPTDSHKLLTQWKGPFEILGVNNNNNYKVKVNNKEKVYHANMLKKYIPRTEIIEQEMVGAIAIIEPEEEDTELENIISFEKTGVESWEDVRYDPTLTKEQLKDIKYLVREFKNIFSNSPSVTNLGEHSIKLTSNDIIRSKPYPVPFAVREILDKEIKEMIDQGVIEKSTSAYASPIVMVKKGDGKVRVCVDYRKLNKITVFDPEPFPKVESIFANLAKDNYFSKFDFCKGYWQIPMHEDSKDYTTFTCHKGLYRFNTMPFGLVNAPATFSRIMNQLLYGTEGLDNYLDDVLAHTGSWKDHLRVLRTFFKRVRDAHLTLNPSKCILGTHKVTFLGFELREGEMRPKEELVEKIRKAPIPLSKKHVRAFLGLSGFYRKFIPNYAMIAAPLTDLVRKNMPNKPVWGEAQDQAFVELKNAITHKPILRLPDIKQNFILQTDASNVGVGAVLLQQGEDEMIYPVAYASKKLLARETRYSTIEKECLAIVWALKKFEEYLYGQEFTLETDHHPLQYLGAAQFRNSRLMRWALAIQPYRFIVRSISGKNNVGADFLSRSPLDEIEKE